MTAEILDACCGGRMWWWNKSHPLAVYMDKRISPAGSTPNRPNWKCEPDIVGDFRAMPFADGSFRLVLFDPPHEVRPGEPAGNVRMHYGSLRPESEQEDLRAGFSECWRVLAPGGTLVFKWAGELGRVRPHFPATPIVGNRILRSSSGLGSRWIIFYKPLPKGGMMARFEAVQIPESDEWEVLDMSGEEPSTGFIGIRAEAEEQAREMNETGDERMEARDA